jgi:glycosyltransferase involved in cell wall biosynthesis
LEKNSFFQYAGLVKNDQFGLALVNYKSKEEIQDLIYLADNLKQYKFFVFGPRISKFKGCSIKRLIKKAPDNIKFKTYVDEDVFKSAMLLSSFFVVTKELEGELVTILEAMVTKTPVFTFSTHFNGDVLNDNVNCICASNKEEMVEKINANISNNQSVLEEAYSFSRISDYQTCGSILKQLLLKYVDLDLSQE